MQICRGLVEEGESPAISSCYTAVSIPLSTGTNSNWWLLFRVAALSRKWISVACIPLTLSAAFTLLHHSAHNSSSFLDTRDLPWEGLGVNFKLKLRDADHFAVPLKPFARRTKRNSLRESVSPYCRLTGKSVSKMDLSRTV